MQTGPKAECGTPIPRNQQRHPGRTAIPGEPGQHPRRLVTRQDAAHPALPARRQARHRLARIRQTPRIPDHPKPWPGGASHPPRLEPQRRPP